MQIQLKPLLVDLCKDHSLEHSLWASDNHQLIFVKLKHLILCFQFQNGTHQVKAYQARHATFESSVKKHTFFNIEEIYNFIFPKQPDHQKSINQLIELNEPSHTLLSEIIQYQKNLIKTCKDQGRMQNQIKIYEELKDKGITPNYKIIEGKLHIQRYVQNLSQFCSRIKISGKMLPFKSRLQLCYKVLQKIQQLQQASIAHLDIKLSNIVIRQKQQSYQVRLIDFGESAKIGQKIIPTAFTIGFVAPQIYKSWMLKIQVQIKRSSDIFSTGIVLSQLIFGVFPINFNGCMNKIIQQQYKANKIRFNLSPKLIYQNDIPWMIQSRQEIRTMIGKCLLAEESRPSIVQLREVIQRWLNNSEDMDHKGHMRV